MLKLQIVPDENNYQVTNDRDVIATKVTGGAARLRRDVFDATMQVQVQFTVDPTEYQYLRAFYNYAGRGADKFLIDLLIETSELTEHVAQIVPGSWKLSQVRGHSYQIKMTLEVHPNDTGLDYADLVNNYTPEPYVAPPAPISYGDETQYLLLGDGVSKLLLGDGTSKLFLGDGNG